MKLKTYLQATSRKRKNYTREEVKDGCTEETAHDGERLEGKMEDR